MNSTQNKKLEQVTDETLIVGVDIGSSAHFARAMDWKGVEFTRRAFKFSNTREGFEKFLEWTDSLKSKSGKTKILVGCEPTGCYWLTFQKFLHDKKIELVTVNPHHVHTVKELDDNSPEKDDLKDPKVIAGLVREGRFVSVYLPEGIYAEIREAYVCKEQLMKQHVRLSNQIQGVLQKYFPEYLDVFKDFDTAGGLMVLKRAPFPEDIIKLGAEGINRIWREAKLRAVGMKKAEAMVAAAVNSVGLKGGEAAKYELQCLIEDYETKQMQLQRVRELLKKYVMQVPNAEKLLAICGVGPETVEGFIAEVGDVGRFTDPKQIQKLAGLEIVKQSSGKKKGKPRISKRGRCRLRRIMYMSAKSLIMHNQEFYTIFTNLRTRDVRPLKSMQAMIATSCKAIRVFYSILKNGSDYDPAKLLGDIVYPSPMAE